MSKIRFNFGKSENTSGQALLIILLTLTVALTVVLSVVSRSVTEVEVTTYEEDAQRAFDAAEAGIEEVLLQTTYQDIPLKPLSGDSKYKVGVTYPTPQNDEFVYPSDLFAGETATFWFVSHNKDDGRLTCDAPNDCAKARRILNICWGDPNTSSPPDATPAIEVSLYYDTSLAAVSNPNDFSNVKIARLTFDPYTARGSNNFWKTSANCTGGIGGKGFAYSSGLIRLDNGTTPNVDLGSTCYNNVGCLLMAKVKMIYNYYSGNDYPHPVGINVQTISSAMPAQGTQLESTGEAGDSTRKVSVFESYAEPPFVFDAALYSGGNILQ